MGSRDESSRVQDQTYLGHSINIATRGVHTKLNKSILAYFPLARPPQAHNPSVYVSGLLHIAPVYLAFESLWQDILDSSDKNANDEDKRIHSVLSSLRLTGLMRSESLLSDILAITGWSEDVVDEELKAVAQTGRLGDFIAHIKRSVNNHPHVLIAYAWVLYMALFSGGRFIRSTLESAGPSFWSATCDPIQPSGRACSEPIPTQQQNPFSPSDPESETNLSPPPLSFFRFATPQDGEDLKQSFKSRLHEAQHVLTLEEHAHVVREAICIFDNMNLLVAHLDTLFTHSNPPTSSSSRASSIKSSSWTTLLGRRIRDSVAVAKERGLWAISASSKRGSLVALPDDGDGHALAGADNSELGPAPAKVVESETNNAQAALTEGTVELVEESLVSLLRRDGETNAEKGGLKVVRFEAEPVVLGGKAEKQGIISGGGGGDGQRAAVEPMVWNLVVALAMVGVGVGFGYVWR